MTVYTIGDIHGRYSALMEVLKASNFDYKNDTLIVLGDVVDGGDQTKQCVSELLKIDHCIAVMGNHDHPWFIDWALTGRELPIHIHQGGLASMRSYGFSWKSVPRDHIRFFENMVPFWICPERNYIFVHGGFDPNRSVFHQTIKELTWNRELINYAMTRDVPGYSHVFVGHTTTQYLKGDINYTLPITYRNLTCCDTGCGWIGKLTIMDVDSREYWQSSLQLPNIENVETLSKYEEREW